METFREVFQPSHPRRIVAEAGEEINDRRLRDNFVFDTRSKSKREVLVKAERCGADVRFQCFKIRRNPVVAHQAKLGAPNEMTKGILHGEQWERTLLGLIRQSIRGYDLDEDLVRGGIGVVMIIEMGLFGGSHTPFVLCR